MVESDRHDPRAFVVGESESDCVHVTHDMAVAAAGAVLAEAERLGA